MARGVPRHTWIARRAVPEWACDTPQSMRMPGAMSRGERRALAREKIVPPAILLDQGALAEKHRGPLASLYLQDARLCQSWCEQIGHVAVELRGLLFCVVEIRAFTVLLLGTAAWSLPSIFEVEAPRDV